ncbi:MAG: hypothetical protein IT205_08330 [Fimbriimonadaceae bacterium]|nr:hypothetical protein [Fimbriimonadaceae bacterium]
MGKKELHPAAVWGAIGLLVVLIGGWFYMSTKGSSEMVDKTKVDMKDEDPPRPGQPGYRQRTTDAPL